MKKATLHLLLIAIIGTGAAWINKPPKTGKFVLHKFAFKSKSSDGTKYYWLYDITGNGWLEGVNYDCIPSSHTCAFTADPTNSHTDANGNYFNVGDIQSTSFETGDFTLD